MVLTRQIEKGASWYFLKLHNDSIFIYVYFIFLPHLCKVTKELRAHHLRLRLMYLKWCWRHCYQKIFSRVTKERCNNWEQLGNLCLMFNWQELAISLFAIGFQCMFTRMHAVVVRLATFPFILIKLTSLSSTSNFFCAHRLLWLGGHNPAVLMNSINNLALQCMYVTRLIKFQFGIYTAYLRRGMSESCGGGLGSYIFVGERNMSGSPTFLTGK